MELVQPIRDKKKLEAMKKQLKNQSVRNHLMFMVGISSALRISDILELKLKDLYDGKNPLPFIELREEKTNKSKRFPITPNLQQAIKEYVKAYPNVTPDTYLFVSREGNNTPITRQHANLILSEAAKTIGIQDNIGCHSMRKTWGYFAYKSGVDIVKIMEALNHSSIQNTKKYIGITQDEIDEVYINLNL